MSSASEFPWLLQAKHKLNICEYLLLDCELRRVAYNAAGFYTGRWCSIDCGASILSVGLELPDPGNVFLLW